MFSSLVKATLLLAGLTSAAEYANQTLCLGPYALCATAYCTAIPGNSSYAHCACEGPFVGLNSGSKTSCKQRTESLISTFSLEDAFSSPIQPPLYAIPCESSNAGVFADCRDQPCTTINGTVTCTCPIQPAGPNFYGGEQCPSNAAGIATLCKQLRSSAVLPPGSTAQNLGEMLVNITTGPFYGNPPVIHSCAAACSAH